MNIDFKRFWHKACTLKDMKWSLAQNHFRLFFFLIAFGLVLQNSRAIAKFSGQGASQNTNKENMSRYAILNGLPMDPMLSMSSSVVYLTNNFSDIFCMGVLIAKGVVLTAGHCGETAQKIGGVFVHLKDTQGNSREVLRSPSQFVRLHSEYVDSKERQFLLDKFKNDPAFKKLANQVILTEMVDLAVLAVEGEFSSGIPIAISAHPVEKNQFFFTVSSVHAGNQLHAKPTSGFSAANLLLSSTLGKVLKMQSYEMEPMFCSGDSGSAVFSVDDYEGFRGLIGILSFVEILKQEDCGKTVGVVNLLPHRQWIGEQLAILNELKLVYQLRPSISVAQPKKYPMPRPRPRQ